MHVMIDTETLGVQPDAALLQVAVVAFEARDGGRVLNAPHQVFNMYVTPSSCMALGGTFDDSTFAWWLGQAKEARERVASALSSGAAKPMAAVLNELVHWAPKDLGIQWSDIEGVWSHGASFDIPLLLTYLGRMGYRSPWPFWNVRDTRTLFHLAGGTPPVDRAGYVAHDALDDCLMQVSQVQKAMGMLAKRG